MAREENANAASSEDGMDDKVDTYLRRETEIYCELLYCTDRALADKNHAPRTQRNYFKRETAVCVFEFFHHHAALALSTFNYQRPGTREVLRG